MESPEELEEIKLLNLKNIHFYIYPLKTSEKPTFSDVFRGYKNVTLDINGLIISVKGL